MTSNLGTAAQQGRCGQAKHDQLHAEEINVRHQTRSRPCPYLIVQDRVAVAEGTALDVLAGESDVVPLEQQRPERQRLGGAPVHSLSFHDRLVVVVVGMVTVVSCGAGGWR